MTSNSKSDDNQFDELPELTKEAVKDASYVNPEGLCEVRAWVDYDVFCWLEQLHGDWDENVNEILKEKMQQSARPE